MQSKIKLEDWAQWVNHPVTQLVKAHIEHQIQDHTETLLNIDITRPDFDLERYGIISLATRFSIDGMAQFSDFEALKYFLVEESNAN